MGLWLTNSGISRVKFHPSYIPIYFWPFKGPVYNTPFITPTLGPCTGKKNRLMHLGFRWMHLGFRFFLVNLLNLAVLFKWPLQRCLYVTLHLGNDKRSRMEEAGVRILFSVWRHFDDSRYERKFIQTHIFFRQKVSSDQDPKPVTFHWILIS